MTHAQKASHFRLAAQAYAEGRNVVELLTREHGVDRSVAIEIAYALQSGSYTDYARTETARLTRREGHAILGKVIRETRSRTVLDCGAGEGTRWLDFDHPLDRLALLDASWHRLVYARRNLQDVPAIAAAEFIKANMLRLPYAPGSFDLVFTSHAIEPNTDHDAELIIASLFRTARKAVVLFEPNYRDAPPRMRERMDRHGYARNIWDVACGQPGFTCVASGDFEVSPNPDNRTSYLAFTRDDPLPARDECLVSPTTGTALRPIDGAFADNDGCFAYPVIGEIMCLTEEDGIFIGCPPGT